MHILNYFLISGVLFALKVVAVAMNPDSRHYVMGWIPVQARYACWVELLVRRCYLEN